MKPSRFYDIESLENVFTAAIYTDGGQLDVYYLINDEGLIKGSDPAIQAEYSGKIISRENAGNPEPLKDFTGYPGLSGTGIAMIRDRIYQANRNFNGPVAFHSLGVRSVCEEFSEIFGVSNSQHVNDRDYDIQHNDYRLEGTGPDGKKIDLFRPACDTDAPDTLEPDAPYLFGYNSYNYDTTMLALFFGRIWSYDKESGNTPHRLIWEGTTAKTMREENDKLFAPEYKNSMPQALAASKDGYDSDEWRIRKNMLLSGLNLDVARLNEKQSKVGLKRLLGTLGYQILESDKLGPNASKIRTMDELADLIAYNASDVINLKNLFMDPLYQGQFELKKELLKTYPELIYSQETSGENTYTAKISTMTVRQDRLNIDSSSAQFSTKALCPYERKTAEKNSESRRIKDTETVNFIYPSEDTYRRQIAEWKKNRAAIASGADIKPMPEPIAPRDILDETRKFFNDNFKDRPDLRARFDVIYHYYDWIRGKNFNDSPAYAADHNPATDGKWLWSLNDISEEIKKHPEEFTGHAYDEENDPGHEHPLAEYDVPFDRYGTCIPYFDTDGNETAGFVLFSTGGVHGAEYNRELYESDMKKYAEEKKKLDTVKAMFDNDPVACRQQRKFEMPDGTPADYKPFLKGGRTIPNSEWKELTEPKLFTEDKKGYSLNKRYVWTSYGEANHEDFPSYYPNLLTNMGVFHNLGLNGDRYSEIYGQKTEYGHKMKDESLSAGERDHWRVMREGTKLILNSASGAADARFDNNIRANNRIIAMRCIGQMFSWRIGQAEALNGAAVPSTNTDGLYTFLDAETNDRVLARESAATGINVEAEPVFLISKDSNNRLEQDPATGKIISASGGTLGCRKGPTPSKALSHPAVIDWALAEYLIMTARNENGLSMDRPFDNDTGMKILEKALSDPGNDRFHTLLMFQNIMASSAGVHSYIYAMYDGSDEPVVLQNINRVFFVKDGTPDAVHLYSAAARKVTPAMKKLRDKTGAVNEVDAAARIVLTANGEDVEALSSDGTRDIISKKCTGVSSDWSVLVCNGDLHPIADSPDYDVITASLDLDKYLSLMRSAYENNWMNSTSGRPDTENDNTDAEEA